MPIASGLLDWNAEAEKLANLFNPLWKRTYDEGADISESIYGLSVEERPEFVSSAKVNGARRIVGIEQTTQRKISDIVVRCVSDGVSQHTLRKAIQDEMKDASAARVKIIARQETMTALATGQFDMMKSAGAKTKTWHHRPRKIHAMVLVAQTTSYLTARQWRLTPSSLMVSDSRETRRTLALRSLSTAGVI